MKGRLGIIDWGIGGISIYKLIKDRHAQMPITYLSDTGATPYGKMGRNELKKRLDNVIAWLAAHGVTHVVIGCNAASTAIPQLSDVGIPILGVIEPAVAAASRLIPKRLAVIGGRRTVVSGVYRNAFADRGIAIEQRIAQPLSALIESGDIGSERFLVAATKILRPIRNSSHILLACTHYPAALDALSRCVSPATKFVDPAGEVAKRVGKWKLDGDDSGDLFYTTGDAVSMKNAAKKAFGVSIPSVKTLSLK